MRTGLFGAVSRGQAVVPGASLRTKGDWQMALGQVLPRHAVQRSVLRRDAEGLHAVHGTWLNAPAHEWDSESHMDEVCNLVADPATFETVEGPLQGCCWKEGTQTLLLHADFARQHPLFWLEHADGLLFAFSVPKLVELAKRNNLVVEPDEAAAAMLLTYGSVLGDQTLVRGIRKLMPGATLTWTPAGAKQVVRSPLAEIPRDLNQIERATDELDDAFRSSVRAMVETNRAAGCRQWNLLSGGLDSRLVTMATSALEPATECLCFSVRHCMDREVSENIAQDLGLPYHWCDLKDGDYMLEVASVMEYDGCVNYLASAHHQSALQSDGIERMGLLGSGQGANVLFTDEHKWGSEGHAVLSGMEWYAGVRDQALPSALKAWQAIPDPQHFKVVNRGFLYTNSGAYSTSDVGVLWSPFVSRRLVHVALRLVPELIRGQRAYLAWMAGRFPDALNYPWERYGVPPVLGWRLRGAQIWAKLRNKLGAWFPILAAPSMSPVQKWHDHSPKIQRFCSETFQENERWLELYPALRASVIRDFPSMSMMNKASVITLLQASKALFSK